MPWEDDNLLEKVFFRCIMGLPKTPNVYYTGLHPLHILNNYHDWKWKIGILTLCCNTMFVDISCLLVIITVNVSFGEKIEIF